MALPNELNVDQWLKKANDDELSMKVLLKEGGVPNTICFLAQQMSEKYFKAFLVAKKKEFPKIHQLDRLLELCIQIDSDFGELTKDAVLLSDYYVDTRYPGNYPEISFKESKKAFESAVRIKEFVLEKLKS